MSITILITGASDGIGKATAELLASAGHEIIIHARTAEKGERACNEIQQKTGNNTTKFVNADFTSFTEIEKMTSDLLLNSPKIDILINNAGVYRLQKNILPNGLEETFMVNHLASFFLTLRLLPVLKTSEQARIINVSSMIHASSIDFNNLQCEKSFDGNKAYSISKLCNLLFTNQLAANLNKSNIAVNAIHPGVINTKLLAAGWGPIGESPMNSAQRFAFLINNESLNNVTGKYFVNNGQTKPAAIAGHQFAMEKLWKISSNLISQQGFKL